MCCSGISLYVLEALIFQLLQDIQQGVRLQDTCIFLCSHARTSALCVISALCVVYVSTDCLLSRGGMIFTFYKARGMADSANASANQGVSQVSAPLCSAVVSVTEDMLSGAEEA